MASPKPRINKKKLIIDTYNDTAEKYAKVYISDGDNKYIDKFLNYLPKKAKVLDIGCGPGGSTKYMNDKGYQAEGIDLSEKMISIAKKKAPGVKFTVMDLMDLKFPDGSFNGILAAWSLIHIPSYKVKKVLKEFWTILKPGGFLLIFVQIGESDRIISEPISPDHLSFVNFFDKKKLTRYLVSVGFRIIFWEENHDVIELDWEGTQGYIFTLVKKIVRPRLSA